jgi:hypothetical protein
LISFDVEDEQSINGALKHEIAHGQFFQQPAYRLAVQTFWSSLPLNIQLAAQSAIGINYDVTNTELLINLRNMIQGTGQPIWAGSL